MENDPDSFVVLCECERPECLLRLEVPAHVYDGVRSNSELFLVVAGHEDPGVDRLVANDGYCIVRVPPPASEFGGAELAAGG